MALHWSLAYFPMPMLPKDRFSQRAAKTSILKSVWNSNLRRCIHMKCSNMSGWKAEPYKLDVRFTLLPRLPPPILLPLLKDCLPSPFIRAHFLQNLIPCPAHAASGWRPTGASLVWQQAALQGLDADLQARYGAGASVIFRRGPYLAALQAIVAALDVGAVFYSRRWVCSVGTRN